MTTFILKIKRLGVQAGVSIILLGICYLMFCKTLVGVQSQTVVYYHVLTQQLKAKGYAPRFWIISTLRPQWLNDFLAPFQHAAAPTSRHIKGEAIDIIVMDVNKDGTSDYQDVSIVRDLLANEVIGEKGGIGTYPNAFDFVSRQMVHFDCSSYAARWEK